MKSQFRHIALIGKTHATLVGSALSASRQVMDKLTHFLHDQGCDVAIERETAAHLGMSGHQELDVKGIGADCDLALVVGGDGTMLGFGRQLAAEDRESRLISYSLEDSIAYLYCREAHFNDEGVRATLVTPQGEHHLRSSLLGRFNLSNTLAAVGALLGLDYALDEILRVLPKLEGPVGRMQRLGGGKQPLVVVDYAHTPDALEKVLVALRPHAKGKLLCLFGCGGDRDRGKRPLMAEIVERLADGVLVTDDNPRSEDPSQIFDDIRVGFKDVSMATFVAGRGAAIAQLIASAGADDVVVLAGKGHEDYQEINGERHAFSDLVEADHALSAWEVAHA